MVQPIQYQIPGALNPFENLVSGLKLGATMADMDTARAQQQAATQLAQQKALAEQAAVARQQQYETGLSKVLTNPNRTYADFEPLFSIAPNKDQLDALKTMGTGADERLKKSQENFTANLLLAIESNPENPEVAKRILNERIDAEKDPQQKQLFQTISKALDVNPEKAAQLVELGGAAMLGKNWYEGIVNARKRREEAALVPSQLLEAKAKASLAVQNAANAVATAPDDVAKAKAQSQYEVAKARLEAVNANVAEGTQQAKIDEAIAIAKKAQIEIKTLEAQRNAELSKAQSDADIAKTNAKFTERIANADLKLKEAQRIASGASTQASLASADLTKQQTLKLKDEIARGPMPTYNADIGGWIAPPTKENPNGSVIPLNAAADLKQQRTALQSLKTAGYDPETGEDNISKLIQKSTGSTLGMLTDEAARFFGKTNEGMKAIASLEPMAKQMALDLLDNKLGAGIANADRDFIVSALGEISNPRRTREEKLSAWNSAKNRMLVSGMVPPPTKVKPEGSFGSAVRSQADAILRGGK